MSDRPPPRTDPPGVPARRAAMRLLDAVLRRGEALESALPGATRGLSPPDRGLAHALAAEVLRWLVDLDLLIDSATRQRLPDDAKARTVLRLALAQALRLRTPGHAAIATVLPLVDGGPRKLVHGVFGTLARQGAALPERPTLPDGVGARWTRAWDADVAESAASALTAPPALDLSLADPRGTSEWAERLAAVSLAPGHLRLEGEHRAIPDLPGFAEGAWWVQDVAASLPARMLADVDGTVLDLCAAPGGKTLQLAAQGKMVTAVDASESRLARLRDNLTRTRLSAEVVRADVRQWSPSAAADAVLLDAPCSATGIFRRHPDVLHRVRPAVIAEMAELQAQLLARAAEWVKPGGVLVYATCSLEPEEGEVQLRRFLGARPDYAVDPPRPGELPVAPTAEGFVRTTPATLAEVGGCDGFFIARLRRAG